MALIGSLLDLFVFWAGSKYLDSVYARNNVSHKLLATMMIVDKRGEGVTRAE